MEVMVAKRPGTTYNEGFRFEFDEVLREADVLSIHCPLTSETEDLIGARELSMMKETAILVNTARGKIVNEDALYSAIVNKEIWGAALDVLSEEPPRSGSKLIGLDRVLVTPHIAWAARESREKLIQGIAKNVEEFKNGALKSLE
jgi:glycerate dehydrogenase